AARPGRAPGGPARGRRPAADDPSRHLLPRGVRPGRAAGTRQAGDPAARPDGRARAATRFALTVERVAEADLTELLPLMRAYCDFYEVAPSDEALLALSRGLIADPEREGVQLLAREGRPVGFATIFWSWATTSAERIGVMNDLRSEERRV